MQVRTTQVSHNMQEGAGRRWTSNPELMVAFKESPDTPDIPIRALVLLGLN